MDDMASLPASVQERLDRLAPDQRAAAMAPPGKACLYVELSAREEPDMAKLLPEVAQGLNDMRLISRPEDIRFARARTIAPVLSA